MRKAITAALAVLAVLCTVGCAGKQSKITFTHNAAVWNGTADGYTVYVNDEKLTDTQINGCLMRLAGGGNYTVKVTVPTDKGEKQIASGRYLPPAYQTEQTFASFRELAGEYAEDDGDLYVYGKDWVSVVYPSDTTSEKVHKTVYIASSVKKITVSAGRRTTVEGVSIVMQPRKTDIVIELENILLTGDSDQSSVISYDTASPSTGSCVLVLYGRYNSLRTGYAAENGADGQDNGDPVNHAGHGGRGGDGGIAVCVNDLYLLVEGDADLFGGNGGNGGRGGDQTTDGGAGCHGSGGAGGNGGDGIRCANLTAYVGEGTLTCTPGNGGAGGREGTGGFGINRSAGSDGSAGQAYNVSGKTTVLRGEL